jgi:DNA-damage-inducible protein D
VSNFGVFQNDGYRGLYGGMNMQNIHAKKKLKKSQKILDHMGSEELAANLFRATQADAKLKRENIRGEMNARVAHYQVGQQVRRAISDIGGTMPENLPTPDGICKAKTRIKLSEKKNIEAKND